MVHHFQKIGVVPLLLPLQRVYGITAFKQGLRLAKFIRQNQIDIVQTFHFAADFWGTLVAKCAQAPVIITGKRDTGFQNSRLHNFLLRLVQPFVDKTICVSSAVQKALTSQQLLNPDKSGVIYNGVDLAEFAVAPIELGDKKKELGLSATDAVVAMVANPRGIKDLETFTVTARKVLDAEPNVRFLVIGEFHQTSGTPSYREKINRLATNLHLNGQLHFLGKRSDIKDLLAVANICVLTSLSEGFSNTLLEYMAAGKPVVVTDVGGNSEAVVDNETGFLVPPRSPEKTAASIIKLLQDPHLAERLGRAGKKRIAKLFTLETMVENYQALYSQLLTPACDEKKTPRTAAEYTPVVSQAAG
ncbi:MAG: D-inositol-3-phosphate glycosyltransferase [bacterium]|nr:D-inositol-3-phosphate glycosyltransferase [bacterium]